MQLAICQMRVEMCQIARGVKFAPEADGQWAGSIVFLNDSLNGTNFDNVAILETV